jgi:hypothetical protein
MRFHSHDTDKRPRQHQNSERDWNRRKSTDRSGRDHWCDIGADHFQSQMDRFRKKIEADPYHFLFGKSNEWLRQGSSASWKKSAFIRAFLGYDEPSDKRHPLHPASAEKNEKKSSAGFANHQSNQNILKEDVNTTQGPKQTVQSETLEFDPISGRMTHRTSPAAGTSERPVDNDRAADTPVQTFKSYRAQFDRGNRPATATSSPDTLESSRSVSEAGPSTKDSTIFPVQKDVGKAGSNANVIYMAGPEENIKASFGSQGTKQGVDGQVQADSIVNAINEDHSKSSSAKPKLEYTVDENKDEDVDLLRASDIRASFFSGKTNQELVDEKVSMRDGLEQDFAAYKDPESDINVEYLRANARKIGQSTSENAPKMENITVETETLASEPKSAEPDISPLDNLIVHEQLVDELREIYESSYGKITPSHRQSNLNDIAAPSEVLELNETEDSPPPWTSIDKDLQNTLQRAKRFTDATALLLDELLISCEHLESIKAAIPDTYRVLAYDSSSQQVVVAETTSSMYSTAQAVHPAEVLLHLNSPAKFLPYFTQMQADGYEIISGGEDILVFRKVSKQAQSSPIAEGSDFVKQTETVGDVQTRDATPAILLDQHQPPKLPELSQSPFAASTRMVRRQETVYTGGPPNWSPYPPSSVVPPASAEDIPTQEARKPEAKSSFGQSIRRVILTGFATAGTFYAIGVVCEYFRTGGQDGLGPEGFTEFEAERRRRG